jgi:Transposase IS4
MTQKRHQEEISGPLDSVEAAPLARDLSPPKRARIQSRKVRENQAQSQPFEVPSLRPASSGNTLSTRKRRQPSNSQNISQQIGARTQKGKEKEEWQKEVESTRNKPEKLRILREVIGPPRPYPEKLNVPMPFAPGRILLRPHECKPIHLFHRFIPKELFEEVADHTNEYAFEERSRELEQKQREWREVTAADIGGYIGTVILIGAQPGGRDLEYY